MPCKLIKRGPGLAARLAPGILTLRWGAIFFCVGGVLGITTFAFFPYFAIVPSEGDQFPWLLFVRQLMHTTHVALAALGMWTIFLAATSPGRRWHLTGVFGTVLALTCAALAVIIAGSIALLGPIIIGDGASGGLDPGSVIVRVLESAAIARDLLLSFAAIVATAVAYRAGTLGAWWPLPALLGALSLPPIVGILRQMGEQVDFLALDGLLGAIGWILLGRLLWEISSNGSS